MKKEDKTIVSEKNRLLTALLAFFFGVFGAHRFYVGKIGTGVIQLLTIGGLGIWSFVDFLIILFGEFRDSEGHKISRPNKAAIAKPDPVVS